MVNTSILVNHTVIHHIHATVAGCNTFAIMPDPNKFRFSIDRGGTFTDVYV